MNDVLYFDIEANGLLDTVSKMHCLVIIDKDDNVTKYRPHEVPEGAKRLLKALSEGDYICGHNIIDYDLRALRKIYPWFKVSRQQRKQCIDTLTLSKLVYSNIKDRDAGLLKSGRLPAALYGKYSLEAFGYRLGMLKGNYGKQENAWEVFTEEMLTYCVQDVRVTKLLHEKLTLQAYTDLSNELEHDTQWLMVKQRSNGVHFDRAKATKLEQTVRARQAVLNQEIIKSVPLIPDKVFVPKRDNKTLGYKKGVPVQKYKDFNTQSRQQIEWIVTKHYGYMPDNEALFDDERLKIDEETFTFIKKDKNAPKELRHLSVLIEESLMLSKLLGQMADGKNAWFKFATENDTIHGRVDPLGAVSARATHSSPNLAQVPSCKKPYGKECRELFTPPPGWVQAGIDASGLELRCLAHFLYPYDGGAYANEVLNGDIHTVNQLAAGLPDREAAKRFIYAYLYGAGDALVGSLIGGTAKDGKRIKKEFLEKTPALRHLKQNIEKALVAETYRGKVKKWKRKYLIGLDGRKLHVRSIHSALNLLLQSAGALICKKWICRLEERLLELGLDHGEDFRFMLWVHDEVQLACRTHEIAEIAVREAQLAMRDTEKFFNFRCQLDTEGKIGKNWADCH